MEKSKNRFWMHDIVQSVRETFNEQRCLCLCLSCYWFWQLFYFQSPGFVSAPHVSGRLLTLAASAVVYALALRWGKKHLAIVASRPYYLWAVGVLIAGGTVCQGMAFGPLDGDMARAVDHAGACAVGIGAALFVIEGGRLCVQVGPRRSLVVIVIGLFGSTLLFVIALLGGSGCSSGVTRGRGGGFHTAFGARFAPNSQISSVRWKPRNEAKRSQEAAVCVLYAGAGAWHDDRDGAVVCGARGFAGGVRLLLCSWGSYDLDCYESAGS